MGTQMNDIVERLRYIAEHIRPIPPSSLRNAASEIERLKAALREIAGAPAVSAADGYDEMQRIARAALEGK